ncbi:carotenoid ester lipase precursor [Mycena crocata]|nr:carotenoid ester lipase precursor [Mycena crocata]
MISLQYGVFQGANDRNLATFLGIPFARPAYALHLYVEILLIDCYYRTRFKLPEAPSFLNGVQNATSFGAACPQQIPSQLPVPLPIPLPTNQTVMSEDCLTLNVFKPRDSGSQQKLPVLVWFYGGGFEFGKAQDTEVRPMVERSIVTGEPVIVVTPNYRVSAFGFLGGKEMNKAGISNLGLRDQIFALEWVQKHIAAFGGDPKRVVIGGFSAGGESTALLLLSNRRFDQSMLFRGAFMFSGSIIPTGSVEDGQPHYDALVAATGCQGSQDSLECLQRVPFDKFIATVNNTPNIFSYSSLANIWQPRIDGDVVAQNPSLSVSQGAYARVVPVLIANVDDEGTFFALSNTNITTNTDFMGYIHSNYIPWATREQIERVSELYPDDPTQGSPFNTGTENQLTPQFKRLAAFTGDYLFTGSRRFFLEHASKTQNVWSWRKQSFIFCKSTPTLGAFHSSDVPMWFLTSNSTDTLAVDALINFINALDPNGSSVEGKNNTQPNWPTWNTPSSDGATSLLTLNDPDGVKVEAENFRVEEMRYLISIPPVIT